MNPANPSFRNEATEDVIEGFKTENQDLQNYINQLEQGILKYCGRPTKDGAKNLLNLVRNYDQAHDALVRVLREEEE